MNNSTTILQTTEVAYVRVNWYFSARFWLSFGLVGFMTNVFEAILICYRRKHKSIFGMTLFSLCIADILSSLCFFVVGLMRLIEYDGSSTITITPNTKFVKAYHGGHGALFFSMGTSFVHIIIIAVQRLFAVFMPFRYKSSFRYKHCLILLISVWILFFGVGVIGYFFIKLLWYATYIMSLTVCGVLILSYTAIVIKNYRADRRREVLVINRDSEHIKNLPKVTHKILNLSIAVTVAFLLCTFPHAIFYLFLKLHMAMYHTVNSAISINPFLDSIIYFFFYRDRKKRGHATGLPSRQRNRTENVHGIALKKLESKELRISVDSNKVSPMPESKIQHNLKLDEKTSRTLPKNQRAFVVQKI